MTATRIFLHGLESSSQGTKAIFLKEKFPDMLVPDFSGPLSARMTKLKEILHGVSDLILVGSSFGGLMATLYGLEYEPQVRRIVLLAPALNFYNFEKKPRSHQRGLNKMTDHMDNICRQSISCEDDNFYQSLSRRNQRSLVPTWLYIGEKDEVTPPHLVEPVARSLFHTLHYHLVEDDHLLHETFPCLDWDRLL